jgi:hypothetical protein
MLAVGVSRATTELSKIQNPAEATPVLSVIIGMIPSETVRIDITSSSRPSCPACVSALPNYGDDHPEPKARVVIGNGTVQASFFVGW